MQFYENYIETANKEQGTATHTSLQTMRSDIANRDVGQGTGSSGQGLGHLWHMISCGSACLIPA